MKWFEGGIGYKDMQVMPLNELYDWLEETNRMIDAENKRNKS